jgi:hypothetical protein
MAWNSSRRAIRDERVDGKVASSIVMSDTVAMRGGDWSGCGVLWWSARSGVG